MVVPAASVARVPEGTSLEAAATLPMNGLTVRLALDRLALQPGQTLGVTGAAGAVGGYLVELGAARGLHVVALAGDADEPVTRSWGARTFVSRSADPAAAVRAVFPDGVDGVIDAANLRSAILGAVREGGKYVTLTPALGAIETEADVQVLVQMARRDAAVLAELARLVDAGELTLRVAETFPLDQAAAAHELSAKGGVRGRIVLVP